MDLLQINSSGNKFFKKIKKLKQKKYRDEFGLFIAEGNKVIELNSDFKYLFIREDKANEFKNINSENCYILNKNLFKELSSQNNSQGVIAVYKKMEYDIDRLSLDVLILDRLQDPGNLGTIIRTFEAAGFKDIILSKGSADIYNEKVVRSSMGAIFKVRSWYLERDEIINKLKGQNYNIIATALASDSDNYSKMSLKDKNAIIFGSEGDGISTTLLEKSNQKIIIPINGESESLNVGVAAGIVIYKYLEIRENL